MKNAFFYDTILGKIWIVENDGFISDVYFENEEEIKDIVVKETPLLNTAYKQIQEYFEGKRKNFELPLNPIGTEFQQKVWKALKEIPYGETRSYGEIAKSIGNPKGARAIGMANNKNPISIFIPCHRVIGASGKLVGYAGGLHIKEKLLSIEKENSKGTGYSE